MVKYVSREEWEAEQSQPYGPDFGFEEEDTAAAAEADSSQQAEEERLRHELQRRGAPATTEAPPSFVDRLNLDLAIRFPERTNPLYVTMDLGAATQQLRAQITDNGFPLYVRQEAGKMTADGSLKILSGSKCIYIKSFNASGDLVFDGDLGNPGISITAVYEGRRVTSAGQNERYSVTIDITGTKERPTINFRYAINRFEQSVSDPDDRTRNAISLLLFGKTTDELRGAGATSQLSDLLNNSINSYGSAALGTFLTDGFFHGIFASDVRSSVLALRAGGRGGALLAGAGVRCAGGLVAGRMVAGTGLGRAGEFVHEVGSPDLE